MMALRRASSIAWGAGASAEGMALTLAELLGLQEQTGQVSDGDTLSRRA